MDQEIIDWRGTSNASLANMFSLLAIRLGSYWKKDSFTYQTSDQFFCNYIGTLGKIEQFMEQVRLNLVPDSEEYELQLKSNQNQYIEQITSYFDHLRYVPVWFGTVELSVNANIFFKCVDVKAHRFLSKSLKESEFRLSIKSYNLTAREDDPQWLQKRLQTALQNAAGNVMVEYDGIEYAIVADYNEFFNSVFWNWDNDYNAGKQIGGKLGIIRDPFGKQGQPKFLGTTTPIQWGLVDHLAIANDGKLYADVLISYPTGVDNGRTFKSLFVWDARGVIQAALDAEKTNQKRNIPIDRRAGVDEQIIPARPVRIDSTSENMMINWISGIGTYSIPGRVVKLDKIDINYSIYTVDPIQAAKDRGEELPEPPAVPDNVYTRTLGITEEQVEKDIASGKTDSLSAAKYFGKVVLYNGWNFFTNGFVDRQGERVKQMEDGSLSNSNYWTASIVDGVVSVGSIAASARVGNIAESAVGGGLKGIAADSIASNAVVSLSQKVGSVITYEWTDGQAGTAIEDSFKHTSLSSVVTQLGSDTITDIGISNVAGLLGRVPKSNYKVMWKAPSLSNPTPFKLVQPTIQADIRGLSGSRADSTGGNVYNNAGGQIVISHSGERIDLPSAKQLDYDEAISWMERHGAKIKDYINPKASLVDQAQQAVLLQQTILEVSRSAMIDGNAASFVGTFQPIRTFDELKLELQKKGYSGDALYKKMVDEAIKNTELKTIGCFAAGTKVHTDQGIKRIEEIQVGDMVLSKPELGDGELCYKPVVKTFEFENKEVWLVEATPLGYKQLGFHDLRENINFPRPRRFIVTPNHPFWVCGQGFGYDLPLNEYEVVEKPRWKRVDQLETLDIVTDSQGHLYGITLVKPLYQFHEPDCVWLKGGWDADYHEGLDGEIEGYVLDWSKQSQESGLDFSDRYESMVENQLVDENGNAPLIQATVYNFEVADYHTYFVGGTKAGIWVHNTECGEHAQKIDRLIEQKITKNINTYSTKDNFSSKAKELIEKGEKPVGITVDGTDNTPAGKHQRDMYGSLSSKNPDGSHTIYAYSLGYPPIFKNGLWSVALGDIQVYKDITGQREFSNTLGDVKKGVGWYWPVYKAYEPRMDLQAKQADLAKLDPASTEYQQLKAQIENHPQNWEYQIESATAKIAQADNNLTQLKQELNDLKKNGGSEQTIKDKQTEIENVNASKSELVDEMKSATSNKKSFGAVLD